MWLTLIVLPDGTEVFSGPGSGPKVMNTTIKQGVNDGRELNFGSCYCASVECLLFNPGGELSIAAGDELTVYRVKADNTIETDVDDNGNLTVYVDGAEVPPTVDADGDLDWDGVDAVLSDWDLTLEATFERRLVGKFTMEEPERPSANRYRVTAYDRVSWLDKDLTDWLISLEGWPYTVDQFANMVCTACGLELRNIALINGDYPVQRFIGQGVTGRKIMQWIGQITGTFIRANADGVISMSSYAETTDVLGPRELFKTDLADYETAKIERVQIRSTGDDIGVIFPDVEGETYAITGNYLLSTNDADALEVVARNLFEVIKDITYTPGTVTAAHNPYINPGDIITVRDSNGRRVQFYVMEKTVKGNRDTLRCTGPQSRESSTVVHEESFKAVNAKMLELRKDVSGLSVRASEMETRIEDNRAYTDEKITEVTITAEGLASTVTDVRESVEGVESRMTAIEQDAESISLRVQGIIENGVDRVETDFGLTIDESAVVISRSGAEVENRLDETGMYVTRSDGTVVLKAAADGVDTQDLKVRGYLDIFGLLRKQAWTDEFGRPCVATLWTGG